MFSQQTEVDCRRQRYNGIQQCRGPAASKWAGYLLLAKRTAGSKAQHSWEKRHVSRCLEHLRNCWSSLVTGTDGKGGPGQAQHWKWKGTEGTWLGTGLAFQAESSRDYAEGHLLCREKSRRERSLGFLQALTSSIPRPWGDLTMKHAIWQESLRHSPYPTFHHSRYLRAQMFKEQCSVLSILGCSACMFWWKTKEAMERRN